MSNWEEKILEDLVFVDKEQLNNSTESDFSFYYIDIGSVSTNQILFPDSPILFRGSPSRARKVLHDGDVLMATVRPNLKAFAKFKKPLNRNCIASTGFAVLSKKEGADIDFIYYTLFSYALEKQIETLVVGSNYPALNTGDIRKLKILAPSLPEQRQIATILSTADAVIEKTQAAIAKYKAIKQGMLQDLFTRGIDNTTGKLRPVYKDAPHLYKESKLGWIPKEWEEKELMNYLSFISYGFTNPMPETDEGPYLITAANVNFGKVQYDSCRKTSKVAFDTLLTDKSKPRVNDILLTKDGTLGRIALVEKDDLCINQSVAVLRPNALIYPLFLKILLESESYQKTMIDEAGGSTIKHIYITIVDKMPIAVPQNMDEQKEIALRMKTIENKLQTEQDFLHKQQQIKAGLMNDLLSGKKQVVVQEASLTQTEN